MMEWLNEHHTTRKFLKLVFFGAVAGACAVLLNNINILTPAEYVWAIPILTAIINAVHNWAKHNIR